MKHYDETHEAEIAAALEGRTIVTAEAHDVSMPGPYGFTETYEGTLTLDDGTRLVVRGNDGGCGCSAGCYPLSHLAATVGALIALEMAAVLMGGFRGMEEPKAVAAVVDATGHVVPYSNTKALGKLLYTQYLYPVEIAAVILLVAMVAAIALTLRQRKDSKAINPSTQIRVRAADRLAVVKVAATQKPAAEEPAQAAAEEKKA